MEFEHIVKYTEIYENHKKELEAFKKSLEDFQKSYVEYRKLVEYYDSKQFMEDFDKSNNGEIDPEINQGILTEDAIYDLIGDNYYLAIDLLTMATDMIKNN